MAVMVWCQSCKTVVWAYDHQPPIDLRGVCNMLKLPCPKCKTKGNFDGWEINELTDKQTEVLKQLTKQPIYDRWSAMKAIAQNEEVEWQPSPDNDWYRRP